MIDAVTSTTAATTTNSSSSTSSASGSSFESALESALSSTEEQESTSTLENDFVYASEIISLGADRWCMHNMSLSVDYDGTDSSVPDEVNELPYAISTWSGASFSMDGLSASGEEQVGEDVPYFHNPSFVEKDGVIYAYFVDHNDDSTYDVGLATSTDGVNFEYQGKVLTKGDSFDNVMASFPSVNYDEESGEWTMLYESENEIGYNSICMATSSDGVNWDKQGEVIWPGDAGDISAVDVGTPTFFKEGDNWHVYFHAHSDDGRTRIGYASGTDLKDLTVQEQPIIDVDASGSENQTVGNRSSVFKSGDYYYMFYEVSENNYFSTDTAKWGINLARAESPDGPWEKYEGGPIVSNPEYGYGYDGPEVLADGEDLYLYYRTDGNTTTRTLITGLDGWGDSEEEAA